MTVLSMSEVDRISAMTAPHCVTIYGDADAWGHGSHLNDAAHAQIALAVDALARSGADAQVVDAIRGRLEQVATPGSSGTVPVDHRIHSVAVFVTADESVVFALPGRPPARVAVSDRFLIGPLLEAALAATMRVFVLAASANAVRLVDVTAHPAREVEVPALPTDLETTIALDVTGDRQTLAHLHTSEDPKERLREYASAILRAVEPVVQRSSATLVVAAAEPLASILVAKVSSDMRPMLLPGNPDHLTDDRLADLAEPLVQELRDQARQVQLTRLTVADPALTARRLPAIESALRAGAVDTLFVDADWGYAEDHEGAVSVGAGDDLIRQALQTGAMIVAIRAGDLDGAENAAALLRYATPDGTFVPAPHARPA